MQNIDTKQGALIVTFAFLLGKSTLAKFFKAAIGLSSQMASKFRDALKLHF